jgi:homoserine O-succinyltransferase
MSKDGKQIFITGHSEYNINTLKHEYDRDKAKGKEVKHPENYYPDNNPEKTPLIRWSSHSNLLFNNWINYYVYQKTPFKIEDIN